MPKNAVTPQGLSRIEELCSNFEYYLEKFDEYKPFTGPSVYFHSKTIERLRALGVSNALKDKLFFEYLYATLASWGMHRMGPKGAKLVDFANFVRTLQAQKDTIISLEGVRLTQIYENQLENVINKLWKTLSKVKISTSKTQLIAGSKTLHHLLPDLVPPIDRQHTLNFVYGYIPRRLGKQEFKKVYQCLWKIGVKKKNLILTWIGKEFHTSETKVIDNAIIGYIKTKQKREV